MTSLLIGLGWLVAWLAFAVALVLTVLTNLRSEDEDEQYARLCSASFQARIPIVSDDWTCGGQPSDDTDRLSGDIGVARQPVNHHGRTR